jgi:hypothetical protein
MTLVGVHISYSTLQSTYHRRVQSGNIGADVFAGGGHRGQGRLELARCVLSDRSGSAVTVAALRARSLTHQRPGGYYWGPPATVAELADAQDLGSCGETREGSSPSGRTARHPCSPRVLGQGRPSSLVGVPDQGRRQIYSRVMLLIRFSGYLASGGY